MLSDWGIVNREDDSQENILTDTFWNKSLNFSTFQHLIFIYFSLADVQQRGRERKHAAEDSMQVNAKFIFLDFPLEHGRRAKKNHTDLNMSAFAFTWSRWCILHFPWQDCSVQKLNPDSDGVRISFSTKQSFQQKCKIFLPHWSFGKVNIFILFAILGNANTIENWQFLILFPPGQLHGL